MLLPQREQKPRVASCEEAYHRKSFSGSWMETCDSSALTQVTKAAPCDRRQFLQWQCATHCAGRTHVIMNHNSHLIGVTVQVGGDKHKKTFRLTPQSLIVMLDASAVQTSLHQPAAARLRRNISARREPKKQMLLA